MAINDEAVEDLGGQANPEVVLNTGTQVTLQEDKEIPPQSNALLDTISSASGAKVAFRDIVDNNNKVMDLQEMAQEIADAGKISKSDAQDLSNSFEGFTNHVNLSEFTRTPSLTNYKFSLEFMKRRTAVVQESLRSKFEAFMNEPLNDTYKILEKIDEDYLPALQQHYTELTAAALEKLPAIRNNKNLILPSDQGFVDLRMANLPTIDLSVASGTTANVSRIKKSLEVFQTLWKNHKLFSSLMCGCLDSKASSEITSYNNMAVSNARTFTIVDLVTVLSSTTLVSIVAELHAQTLARAQALSSVIEKGRAALTDSQNSQNFLIENSSVIGDMLHELHNLSEVVCTLLHCATPFEVLVQDFASF